MIVSVMKSRKLLPDWKLLAMRMSLNVSYPNARSCEPRLSVDRNQEPLTSRFSLSRCSGLQTPQQVGLHQRAPEPPSTSRGPQIRSVNLEPEFSKVNSRSEYCASTKTFSVSTPV